MPIRHHRFRYFIQHIFQQLLMPTIRSILPAIALSLAALGMGSCTTVIDTGSALDAIGKQSASHLLLVKEKRDFYMELEEAPISVYKLGATYYVKLPVAFIPADIRNDDYLIYNMGVFVGQGEEFTYPSRRMDLQHITHKHQTKPETFYAVLTEEQFRLACQPWGKFDTPPVKKESFAFVPAAELNLDGAKKINIKNLYVDTHHMICKIPDRRTWGNQLRRPLVWVLDVVDIPLGMAVSPIGWLARLLYFAGE